MRRFDGTVYLKKPVNLEIETSTLVHEASHILHFLKFVEHKDRLSGRWKQLFPNERRGREIRNPKFLEESGLIIPYAGIDYNIDNMETKIENYPQGDANFLYLGRNAEIYIYGKWNYDKVAKELDQEVGNLPGELSRNVGYVVLTPDLIADGRPWIDISILTPLWWSVAEDIAASTECFHAAYNRPDKYGVVIEKVNSNPLTRKRLEVLVDEGFLDQDTLRLIEG